MSENILQIISVVKLLWVAIFAGFYGFGGISNKWLRRFIGPLWMGLGLWVFGMWTGTFSPWQLLYVPLLCASLHLGYGGVDDTLSKIRKRAIYGVALGVSAIPLCISSHLWGLFAIHVGCCVMGSVLLGVYNPSRNARSEETLIGALSTMFVLFLT